MAPPPLKEDRTHFCSSLCCSRAARRYKWCHGNDYSSTGLGRDRNITSHSIHPRAAALGTPLTPQEMVPNTLTRLKCTLPTQMHLPYRHISWLLANDMGQGISLGKRGTHCCRRSARKPFVAGDVGTKLVHLSYLFPTSLPQEFLSCCLPSHSSVTG